MLYSLNKLRSYSTLLTMLILIGISPIHAYGKEYFNPNALSNIDDSHLADLNSLEQFSSSGAQLPGNYRVSVIVNDKMVGIKNIDFIFDEHNQQLEPVLTKEILKQWGVKTDAIPTLKDLQNNSQLIDIEKYIEYATTQFIFSKQTLKVNIPQIALNVDVRDRIDPALFDQGMPAFILNYDLSGARTWNKNNNYQDDRFLSLRSGFNLGAWRLRNYSTYDYNNGKSHWDNINTYLERDIQPLNSQLTIGDTSTEAVVFDGFQFKGIKLASDESMLPYSLRGFAPVVRGFAQSNAKVTVRQNGSIIYQTYVAPGPFALTDLYPTSYSGNLDVTVVEEDGSKKSFVVPFSSLAIMQREGGIKYSAVIGKYRSENNSKEPNFVESTLIYGLPWNTTLFGGTLLSGDYKSYAMGLGFNFGDFGAISFDGKHATTKLNIASQNKQGQAYRAQYSKTLQSTDSTISLEAVRYSSKDFYDFSEANENNYLNLNVNKRSRYQANLSQSLGEHGSFYLSGYLQDYWQSSRKESTFSAGYNIVVKNISFGLSYGHTESHYQGNSNKTNQVTFRVNIPLDEWLPGHNYLTTNISSDGNGNTTMQAGLSGNTLDNRLTYSVQQNHEQQSHYTGGNASVGYEGSSGSVNLGYAYTEQSKRLDYGVQGGVVVHPYGVTLSQTLSDTIAVVTAPSASYAPLQNTQGVETNRWGYAIKPYLTPYTENKITLNIGNLGNDVDIVDNNATVIPTKGAVVLAKINTHVGFRLLMTLTSHGAPLPFGAIVTLKNTENSGIVGDGGEVYLSGMPTHGELIAKWGGAKNQTCRVNYSLSDNEMQQSIKFITAQCIQ